ncbi:PAS domain-containing protein [Delftia deserti]|uniref:histidine kinase n=1 Tax=Delftia deserti TaxID=1651218 RepID=A0ABW5F081_9BURK
MRAKPPRSLSRLLNAEPLAQTAVAVWVGVCCVLLATVAYWTVLVDSHRTQRSFTESQSWLRVGQMSHAVSVQVQTLLSGLDYTMRGLESDFADGDADGFRRAVQTTFDAYPAGTFLQIAVADENGDIVYSNLQQEAETRAAKVSIRDREHFQVHASRENMGMFIGRPVQGRVSHKWTIQLSRALYRQGRFSGVLVLSLSPEYISSYFQSIFDGARDVILLLRTDGAYLARSQGQDEVMGRSVSDVRVALFAPALERGTYEAESTVDGVQRMYAWSRVGGYPLIVSAGLDKKAIFEPLEASLERGLLRNGIGTAVLLLGMLLTLWLARQRQLSERMRLQGERRFARLAQEVPGGLFQFRIDADGQFRFPFTSAGFFELHGAKADAARFADHELLKRVHPEDLPALATSVRASVDSKDVWEHKYRVYGPGGELRWLHGHARPQQEEDGSLLWHGYVHDVTQDQAMQESIRHSEERLRLTVGAVRDGLWQWDCRSGHVEWDARCYQMLGFAAAQFPMNYDAFCAMVHPSDRARMLALLQRHAEAGADFRVEMRLRSSAESWLWVESRGEITQRDSDGKPVRMLGTHTDIQQRVEQSRLIKALLDRGSALIVMTGPQREILYANERGADLRDRGRPAARRRGLARPACQRRELRALRPVLRPAQRTRHGANGMDFAHAFGRGPLVRHAGLAAGPRRGRRSRHLDHDRYRRAPACRDRAGRNPAPAGGHHRPLSRRHSGHRRPGPPGAGRQPHAGGRAAAGHGACRPGGAGHAVADPAASAFGGGRAQRGARGWPFPACAARWPLCGDRGHAAARR